MTAITTNPGSTSAGSALLVPLATQPKGTVSTFVPVYPYTAPSTGQLWPRPY